MTLGPGSFGVIVPARFASTRLPGKPLLDLGGKPMVVRVLEIAARAGAAFALVATDDQRIVDAVRAAGGEALLTSAEHATGTDRLAEVAHRKELAPDLIVVNLQGDEPSVPPEYVTLVADTLRGAPRASLATLATPIHDRSELFDPNVVKVVRDDQGRAMYFSRAPIPWQRGDFERSGATEGELPAGSFLRHIGLYAYRVSTLLALSQTPPAPLERAESLEQLRALASGLTIQLAIVDKLPGGGVDVPDDVERARKLFETG
jgi:3-deoxy-manno-octulosonate cytidylyltransferase (CMP-KDO synthetase)